MFYVIVAICVCLALYNDSKKEPESNKKNTEYTKSNNSVKNDRDFYDYKQYNSSKTSHWSIVEGNKCTNNYDNSFLYSKFTNSLQQQQFFKTYNDGKSFQSYGPCTIVFNKNGDKAYILLYQSARLVKAEGLFITIQDLLLNSHSFIFNLRLNACSHTDHQSKWGYEDCIQYNLNAVQVLAKSKSYYITNKGFDIINQLISIAHDTEKMSREVQMILARAREGHDIEYYEEIGYEINRLFPNYKTDVWVETSAEDGIYIFTDNGKLGQCTPIASLFADLCASDGQVPTVI